MTADAVVIGGGFYGTCIAIYLSRVRGLSNVLLVEAEDALLQRASYTNQARVHNGYHYPRSFTTAYRSRVNLPRFVNDWPAAVNTEFHKLYAIAKVGSKVTSAQFVRFCREIGAEVRPAEQTFAKLFNPALIERAFEVQEYGFDTRVLANWAEDELRSSGVEVNLGCRVNGVFLCEKTRLRVTHRDSNGSEAEIFTDNVLNCTYSGLNHLGGDFAGVSSGLKQEITEMALVDLPDSLRGISVTVMDGPFFSFMPFPARGLNTLSHVRYTPHLNWQDEAGRNPYSCLDSYPKDTRALRIIRDSARYVPHLSNARYVDSIYEIKTVLQKNEGNDGRPILFERSASTPGLISVLGGKLDNIYDVLEKLDEEKF